jgi:hypothetical protein
MTWIFEDGKFLVGLVTPDDGSFKETFAFPKPKTRNDKK